MIAWLSSINDLFITFANGYTDTVWIFFFLWLFILLDGVFPIFPSESLVIGLVALSVSTGEPNLWIIAGVAVVGAMCGDLTAYHLGRKISSRHWKALQGPRLGRMLNWASEMIIQRPAPVIISARYIPVGRVAVNFMAGRMAYPRRAFLFFVTIAAITWSAYSTLIGVGAGAWLGGHPILAVPVGVAGGMGMGVLVDIILRRVLTKRAARGHSLPSLELAVALSEQQRNITIDQVELEGNRGLVASEDVADPDILSEPESQDPDTRSI